jgi:hypothetical protein
LQLCGEQYPCPQWQLVAEFIVFRVHRPQNIFLYGLVIPIVQRLMSRKDC